MDKVGLLGEKMFCIFEGCDASGKDTLRQEFERLTNYEHTCVTRFMLSQLVYARYFERPLWTDTARRSAYLDSLRIFMHVFNPVIVLTTASREVLTQRIRKRGEDPKQQPDSRIIQEYYQEAISLLGLDRWVFRIETDLGWDLQFCARKLQRHVRVKAKEMNNEW